MSLRFVTQKLKTQSLADLERAAMDEQEDSGSESDDERGTEDDQDEVSVPSPLLRSTRSRSVTASQQSVTSSVSDQKSVLALTSSTCDILGDDNYSSEEELKEINVKRKYCQRVDQKYTEKRKWSEMSLDDEDRRSDQLPRSPLYVVRRGSSGGSSEGLPTPVQFCTSPPLDVYRPGRSQSPPQKLFHLVSTSGAENAQLPDSSTASTGMVNGATEHEDGQRHSPSKRHRLTPRPQRPCLDFEKMQQIKKRVVTSWRPQGTELSLFCW